MPISGDVLDLELGSPTGREAGLRRPVVVVTAKEIIDESASVVQVVPLTTTTRAFGSEVEIQADDTNGLEIHSAAQCQHIRSVSVDRVESVRGNVGAAYLVRQRGEACDSRVSARRVKRANRRAARISHVLEATPPSTPRRPPRRRSPASLPRLRRRWAGRVARPRGSGR